MRTFYVSAASIALACGLSSAKADDSGEASTANNRGPALEGFAASEAGSTLLPQVQAVLAALRQRAASSAASDEEAVVEVGVMVGADQPDTKSDCQLMPIPGSRIREMRCYAPTSGEAALNEYQFQEEIRQLRQQDAIRVMEQAQQDRARLEAVRDPTGGPR